MQNRAAIGIIGLGRLGTSLALALQRVGCKVVAAYDKDQAQRRAFAGMTTCRLVDDLADLPPAASIWFLTVPDDALEPLAADLSGKLHRTVRPIFVHCSGAHSAAIFSSLQKQGCATASVHPLQTFNASGQWQRLYDIYYTLEGDALALQSLEPVFTTLGKVVFLPGGQKNGYHLSCVIAANFFVVLQDAAIQAMQLTGLPQEQIRRMLYPLMAASLENGCLQGPVNALTGPFVRGDHSSLNKHYRSLSEQLPEFKSFYLMMAKMALKLAARQTGADRKKLNSMEKEIERLQRTLG